MKNKVIFHPTKISSFIKRAVLLFMVILITAAPLIPMVFELYDTHFEVYELHEEDESKEKVIFSYDDGIKDQKLCSFQKQSSPNSDIFLTDYKPEVPFPPPKNI